MSDGAATQPDGEKQAQSQNLTAFMMEMRTILDELRTSQASTQKKIDDLQSSMQKNIDELQKTVSDLHSEMQSNAKDVADKILPLIRDLDEMRIDVKMVRERDRRPVRDYSLLRAETETLGSGHGSYPWERRLATPRIG